MNKKKNIKIKRSKSRLYKKKRSPAKTVLETVVLVLLAGGLIYVGYSAAGPLIEYISAGGSSDTVTGWTPAESDIDSESGDPQDTSAEESTGTSVQLPAGQSIGTYLLPQQAASSRERLLSELDKAQKASFGTVLIPMKNTDGNILYSTKIEYIKDQKDLVTGTLSAQFIAEAAKERGLIPKAVIPTLLDKTTPSYVEDTGYTAEAGWAWLDNAQERGGKRWVDPYGKNTKKYYQDIAKELKEAGFEEAVLSELRYPDFNTVDYGYLAARNFAEDRYKALTDIYNSAYTASDKKAAVSVDIKDVLDGQGQGFVRTAEILSDKSFSGKIFLTVNLSDFGSELAVAEGDPVKLPSDPAKKAAALIGKASEYLGTNVTVVPVIRGDGMSIEQLVKCYGEIAA